MKKKKRIISPNGKRVVKIVTQASENVLSLTTIAVCVGSTFAASNALYIDCPSSFLEV